MLNITPLEHTSEQKLILAKNAKHMNSIPDDSDKDEHFFTAYTLPGVSASVKKNN